MIDRWIAEATECDFKVMKSIRDAVWNVPCDAIFLLVNTDTYGGRFYDDLNLKFEFIRQDSVNHQHFYQDFLIPDRKAQFPE